MCIRDRISELFPDEYIHIGGDENNGKHWSENDSIKKFMTENNIQDNHELQAYFNKRIHTILTRYNKKMIGWDEILHEDLPTTIVIQSWRGKEALVESAKMGYRGILSNGFYIDLMQPTDFHYLNDPVLEQSDLSESEIKNILGGEATMWSEWVTPENIDSRIWPRTAAIAERLWSPREVKDVAYMYKRLDRISLLLEELDLTHISFQEKMLRRLTGGYETEALKTLIDVIEPLKEYERAENIRKYGKEFDQQSPYTRVIDAALADAREAREFRSLMDTFLESTAGDIRLADSIISKLELWQKNHIRLLPVIKRSPILFEIEPLSEKLAELSEIGISLMKMKLAGNSLAESSKKEYLEIIEKAEKPVAQTEIMIVSAVKKLLNSI
jgi:hexosaminidase